MNRSSLGLRIPTGMRDLLPEEMAVQDQLEGEIVSLFKLWAYQKVATPSLEYGACLQPDEEKEDLFYKFFDRQGHVLVLRPELTTPIARMVSSRLKGSELPLRLCYSSDVYRTESNRHQEFRQAGVELIGSGDPLADAEVIALAIESLRKFGLKDFQFNLGHMGIFSGIMDELKIDTEFRLKYEERLAHKDLVGIERIVEKSKFSDSAKRILLRIPHFHGQAEMLEEVLDWSQSLSLQEAVASLRKVYEYLKDFNVQEYVALDLGILRGFSYYTGVIFEGYVRDIGYPIVEGGRYDALYGEFGYALPATGFAMNLGALAERMSPQTKPCPEVLVYGEDVSQVIQAVQKLRGKGVQAEMGIANLSAAEVEMIAKRKGIAQVKRIE
ncbi:ATP phosphoribosyltransferase regulatory subunit [Desulfitobacterium metallireducens]|uniref:ATP phosphoribosyltransferase regulatory subunit n=1 Tax=Desulfitobacterium metallireducens DSM 15288 TaxID=871968 RepID=W0EA58_9FIRM|nr:ATP phosphoribosyltransferase regulatory subunit [Desulfitobacterium metallireducens]AHF06413.1 ATP phosphoribosyltransferase [Desulfitobacterium metallireducens DSM 15288]